jgi:hypothetical protein
LREETAINNISELIAAEREKITAVSGLKKQIAEKDVAIRGYEKDRSILVPSTKSTTVAQQLEDLLGAADKGKIVVFRGASALHPTLLPAALTAR